MELDDHFYRKIVVSLAFFELLCTRCEPFWMSYDSFTMNFIEKNKPLISLTVAVKAPVKGLTGFDPREFCGGGGGGGGGFPPNGYVFPSSPQIVVCDGCGIKCT